MQLWKLLKNKNKIAKSTHLKSRKEVANTKFSLVDWSGDVFYTHHIIIHQTTKGWTHPLVVEEKVLALFIEGLKQQQEEALVALYEEY